MKVRDVREVIHEALVMYIDDFSIIESVQALQSNENAADGSGLEVTLKTGDKYYIMINPILQN